MLWEPLLLVSGRRPPGEASFKMGGGGIPSQGADFASVNHFLLSVHCLPLFLFDSLCIPTSCFPFLSHHLLPSFRPCLLSIVCIYGFTLICPLFRSLASIFSISLSPLHFPSVFKSNSISAPLLSFSPYLPAAS